MGTCVMTTASDVSDSNDSETFGKSGLPRAGLRNCGIESLFCGIFLIDVLQIVCMAAAQNVTDRSAFVTDKFIFCY